METKVWMLFGRAMKIYIFVPKNLSKTEWNWFRISAVEIFGQLVVLAMCEWNDLNREQIVIYLHLIAFGFVQL